MVEQGQEHQLAVPLRGHVGAKRYRDREPACWTLPGQSRSAVRPGVRTPEAAVGYTENWMRDRLAANGLAVVEPIHFGNWCGRKSHLSYQDIVIINKNVSSNPSIR
jgi:hypothetical protein